MHATLAHTPRIAIVLATLLALAGASAGTARAEENRLAMVEVEASFAVDCRAPRVAGQQEIGRLFDVANGGQAYALRQRLQLVALRACHSGAQRVLIARRSQGARQEPRYVALQD
jgi:hypothetical protein